MNSTFRNPYTNSNQIECALSHYIAWKRTMKEVVKYPKIMEDHIEFTAFFF